MRHDHKHVALEKIRDTLNLLRKSNLGSNYLQREDSLLNRLKALQNLLRYDENDVIDPFLLVDPFLAILLAPFLAGPFKLVALDALQTFTSCNLFSKVPESCGETLAKVVDAVTRCKFVQTDVTGDELVQLQIIHTLSSIIKSPVSCYLTDATAWDIIAASHSILIHIAATGSMQSIVYQAAEKTIIDASRFIFSSAGRRATYDCIDAVSDSSIALAPKSSLGPSCVCAVKVLNFFVGILLKFCSQSKGGPAGTPSSKRAATTSQGSNGSNNGTPVNYRRVSDLGMSGESVNAETREVLFCIKAIHSIFLAEGNLHGSRTLISNHEPLAALMRDDLGRCLILLCSRRDLPTPVLQNALGLFSLTVQLMGPTTRILVECFMRFIYIKAILQVRIMFAAHDEFMRVLTENQSSKEIAVGGGAQAQAVVGAPSSFSIEELEIVLESLADLLADLGFLPSLFASFDCDPSKGDIVQPLVKYLTSCMRYTLVSEPAELNISGLLDVGGLIEQCYAQMSFTLSQRDVLKVAASSLGSGSASGRGLDGPSEADNIKKQLDVKNLAVKLRLTRLAKGVLAEAALRFSTKPQDGLKFLQAKGVLPSPLTPASVAKFLRIAPGLPNECTGSFLGELGKDNPSYEADGKAFHREVLLCYVRSFELKGQTVLNCMRIFLSAFRLPGEAQQIDRILVAFSEYCHAGSIEGNSGLLENPEVTYLLTFSMIMLNTDLHNPNVRADRKMTIAQFIKNNSFYGAELNQTKNIPKEYLEAVYASLSQVPLRTERNDLNASITPEMWMDLQLQATINTEKGLMLSTSYSLEMTRSMTRKVVDVDSEVTVEADIHAIGENGTISTKVEPDSNTDPLPSTSDADKIADVARRLLTDSSAPVDGETMALCERFRGMHWLVDEDFLSCTFQDFFGVAVCPFFMHRFVVAPCARTVGGRQSAIGSSPHEHGAGAEGDMAVGSTEVVPWRTRHASVRALGVGIDSSLLLLGLLHSNGMQASIEGLLLLFADIVGISVEDNMCYTVLKSLSLTDFEVVEKVPVITLSLRPASENKPKIANYRNSTGSNAENGGVKGQGGDVMMEGLLTSIAARAALGTLLLVTHRHPSYLGRASWRVMWMLLSMLRDYSLLPSSMIVLDSECNGDTDLIPPACRDDFEARLLASERREVDAQLRRLNMANPTTPNVKKSSSLMSLQGLGEALFGTGQSDQGAGGPPASLYCTVPARWDVGYEGIPYEDKTETSTTASTEIVENDDAVGSVPNSEKSVPSSSSILASQSKNIGPGTSNSSAILLGEKSKEGASEYEDVKEVLAAFIKLRDMVSACGIAQIVSDTRFYSEDVLDVFLEALVAVAQAADGFHDNGQSGQSSVIDSAKPGPAIERRGAQSPASLCLDGCIDSITDSMYSNSAVVYVSPSSVSWLENLLVETSLRNRDRLFIFWVLLSQHYEKTIQGAVVLTYPLERRITSLFRLSARMISRDAFTQSILVLFQLFVPPSKPDVEESNGSDEGEKKEGEVELGAVLSKDSSLSQSTPSKVTPAPVGSGSGPGGGLLLDLSAQVSAGMWRVLTNNLEVLPTLSLSQWQIIFDVIAACAGAGGYSSIKAFESMAWLLHESRLQGEIPMFCIVGIRPLLCNNKTTISVSVGAVKLLAHLHSRLEVLFTAEEDYVQVDVEAEPRNPSEGSIEAGEDQDSDTPLLWESCWTPILSAMAEGCMDSRKPVRLAASNALCAAILDRHVRNVPVVLMVKILGDVYITVILRLAEFLIKEKEAATAEASSRKSGGSSWKELSGSKKAPSRKDSNDSRSSSMGARLADNSPLSAQSDNDDLEEMNFTVMPLLCTICKVFVDQIKRLASYPTFDRLWLRLVYVFGYFLGAAHGFDHSTLLPPQQQHQMIYTDELHRTVAACGDHLATLITLLVKSGVFEERSGLWAVTMDSLNQMTHRPPDLFPTPIQDHQEAPVDPTSAVPVVADAVPLAADGVPLAADGVPLAADGAPVDSVTASADAVSVI